MVHDQFTNFVRKNLASIFLILSFCNLALAQNLSLDLALEAASTGNIQIVKKYKTDHSDLNAQNHRGINLLMQAAASGQMNVVNYLLQQKVNLELKNTNGDTALVMAITNDQDLIAEKLIKAGAKTDVLGGEARDNLVYLAAATNAKKTLQELMKKAPGLINTKNSKGETALHQAARYGNYETLQILLKAGAKKDIANNDGKKPLDLAKEIQNEEAIKLLK